MVNPVPWTITHLHRSTTSVEQVLDESLGIYSTQPTGHLELAARVDGYSLGALTRVVEEERSAVRLRTLRGSGFVIPTQHLPVAQAVSRERRTRSLSNWLFKQLSTPYDVWAERVEAAMVGEVLGPQEIKDRLGDLGDDAKLIRYVLNMMAYECRLVSARVTGSWRSDRTELALWSEWLPDVDVWSLDEDSALGQLVVLYLDRHGPATPADFSFWSGVPKGKTTEAFGAVAEPVDGTEHWATRDVVEHRPPPVRLLPIWDTLFVTYRDRSRFLAPEHYPLVYDKDGNATSVVLVDGWAAGVWDLGKDDADLEIKVAAFDRFSSTVWEAIEEEVHRIGRIIGSESATMIRCSDPIDLTTQPRNAFMNPLRSCES